jgi:hypothetical protein
MSNEWAELRGYVQEAVDDGGTIDPRQMLSFIDELRARYRHSLRDALARTRPHTCWYWIDDPNDPIPAPYSFTMDSAAECEERAQQFIEERNDPQNRLRWVKVFRADNEAYETFRWDNPEPVSS